MKYDLFFHLQSFFVLGLIYTGVYLRKKRPLHIKIMSSAIILDILLILQIELSRGAINKASKVVENPLILSIHVAMAITTVILYFCLIFTGRKVLKGQINFKFTHFILGVSAVTLRTLTLITSFFTIT